MKKHSKLSLSNKLSSTFIIAIFFHAILILGITFTGNSNSNNPHISTLKITLTDQFIAPKETENIIRSNPILTKNTTTHLSSEKPQQQSFQALSMNQNLILGMYLDKWKRKVEKIGAENLPKLSPEIDEVPTVEVTLGPNGYLEEILITKSSGSEYIDQSTIKILRLAQPFDPLPIPIIEEHETLRFAYEWHFPPK
ncbi:MAG: hypothetical protein CMM56_10100 [Rhodospirillaceae bacterium]|nr:hypothetical protein [Rhodospirillaceae bacterium]|tara:strand:- start:767 stop:1354 length:588 start_codon:yes stop_codon:yes gene_type:complete